MPTFPGPTVTTQARAQGIDIPREDEVLRRSQASEVVTRVASPKDFVSPALKRAAEAITQIGVQIEETQNTRDAFDAQVGLLEFTHNQRRNVTESTDDIDGASAGDFEANTLNIFDTNAKTFFATVPDSQKAAVDLKLRTLRNSISDKAFNSQRTAAREYFTEQVTNQMNSSALAVRGDPTILEEQVKSIDQLVETADIPASKKRALRAEMRNRLVEEAAVGMALQGDFKGALGLVGGYSEAAAGEARGVTKNGGTIVDRIIQVESGGKAGAKNKRSTATGLGQFIESTWLEMMNRYHPELARRRTRAQLLALRKDPTLSREMTARYVEENAASLKAAGIEPTAGNVYLAHFLGPGAKGGGAVQVLSVADDTPLATIIPAKKMKANPFLRGKDVAWLKRWATQKMGSSKVMNNVEVGPKWVDRVTGRVNKIRTGTVEAASTSTRDEVKRLILQDPNSITDDQIDNLDGLTTAHKNELTIFGRAQRGKNDALRSGRLRLEAGMGPNGFNERDPDDRKAVDALATDPDTLPDLAIGSPERAVELTKRTGIADRTAVRTAVSGIHSTDQREFAATLEFASQLFSASGRAFDGVDGSTKLKGFVRDYQDLRRDGLSPEAAARAVFNARSTEAPPNITQLRTAANEQFKAQELTAEDLITKIYDGTINPELAVDSQLGAGLVTDWKQHWTRNYIESNGNLELAELRTKRDMRRLYGTSEVAGTSMFGMQGDFVKWPFENYYRSIGDRGHQPYLEDAAKKISTMLGRELSADDVRIIADPIVTGRDASSGPDAKPRFRVYYTTEVDGQEFIHTPPGEVFYKPDEAALVKAWREPLEADRRRERRLQTAEDGITVGIDRDGNEVLINVHTREVMEDVDGVTVGTGQQYRPPNRVFPGARRGTGPSREMIEQPEGTKVDPEFDIVQPTPAGRPGRIVRPDDFEDLAEGWREFQERIKKRKRGLTKERQLQEAEPLSP